MPEADVDELPNYRDRSSMATGSSVGDLELLTLTSTLQNDRHVLRGN